MKSKKILFSDYDKTFYINDEDIEKNKKSLLKYHSLGNIFVITTGRSYYDYYKKKNKYNFESDYVILNHGATIIDSNDNLLFKKYIKSDIVLDIKKYLSLNKAEKYFCCGALESRVDFNYEYITKVYIKYKNEEDTINDIKKLRERFDDIVNIYHISPISIEIVSKEASKVKAIDFLIERLGIEKKDVFTIGDGYSDIEMVKKYNGCCMKDSVDELKQYSINEYESVSIFIDDIIGGKIK